MKVRHVVCGLLLVAFALPVVGQDAPAKKYALLVGAQKYQHPKLRQLRYSQNDVTELAKVLKEGGYEVTLLCDREGDKDASRAPTRKNINDHLDKILARCRRSDSILIAFAGHGLQFENQKDSYFCPTDARPFAEETGTMILIGKLYEQLDRSFADTKVVLVDACRDDPKLSRGRSGINGDQAPRPPRGVAVLFSCAAGEMAFEHEKYQHGVFFYHVLQGLRGAAKNGQGKVTFASLADHASTRVAEDVPKLIGEGAQQSPNMKADVVRQPILLNLQAGHVIENSIRMKLAYIPQGKFLMGSPKDEKERFDSEFPHEVEFTRGFYMGVYAVTQEEYETVTGKTPSYFSGQGDGKGKVAGMITSRFPVEKVSWHDAKDFCRKLSQKEGKTYRLPSEAEWEYACRAGTTTPFHFGETIATYQANYNGAYVYGNGKKGEYRARTMKVGSFPPNAWGLYDMHGNVFQWCEDRSDAKYYENSPKINPLNESTGDYRALRGGPWLNGPSSARSAYRDGRLPSGRLNYIGFRVVLTLL